MIERSPPRPLQEVVATRIDGRDSRAVPDRVAEETPVALVYNGVSRAVMMATPVDLEDFALGFTLSEGIVARADECRLLGIDHGGDGVALRMAIPEARAALLGERQRGMVGRSGCGVCGADSLASAIRPVRRVPAASVSLGALRAAFHDLQTGQTINRQCHGLHAAGFAHGGRVIVREDVGRHNALDKALGARARAGLDRGFLVVTSRASFEMVHKAAEVGVSLLAAISAPTAMAIRLAERAGLTLVAFARNETLSVYAHPDGLDTRT